MHRAYSFGGAPNLKKYQIQEAMATSGVPVIVEVLINEYGLGLASTSAAANMVGVTLDAQATLNTAQQTGNADPSVYVTVDVDPHIVLHAPMAGGATSGTALSTVAETAGSTTGLTLTSSLGTAYDDGYAWGADGNNVGQPSLRKVIAVDGSTSTFVVAQQYDIAVGDTFYACTFGPASDSGVTLTTTLDEVDATSDGQANNNFRAVYLHVFDSSEQDNGRRSWAELRPFQHLFGTSA